MSNEQALAAFDVNSEKSPADFEPDAKLRCDAPMEGFNCTRRRHTAGDHAAHGGHPLRVLAVKVIDGLEELYKPDTAVSAPSEPVAPAAVAAEPVAAPVAG